MADEVTATGGQGFPADNKDGTPGLIGPDDYTRQSRIARINQDNVTVLSGNIADMQRAGTEIATGKDVQGVAAPPGIDTKSDKVVTPAQAEAARGEFTRETERTGLLDAPVAADPPENKEANSIDPTSQSPQTEAKTGPSSPTPQSATKK